ncbi:phosphatase [Thermosediminibacter litoriperuensis]|uniref:Putative hydrolase n=1 Tax=Thermosediminibacter litoriperuensis TaxID=291989 RepID=A0A5S5AWE1_9FIRM|nr:putative hydrolase [Thermosediminibacter litoriperuensis]
MKLEVDTHCHTVASGHAYSTVIENAKAAAQKGLRMIAITDHGPSMPGGPHLYHFGNLKVLPRQIEGVYILRGVEANILDYDGTLDLPEAYLRNLDIVLAGFHTYCYRGGNVEENTRAAINAMKNPYVDILVHPGNPEFPIDIDKVVKASVEYGVHLEINNSSFTVSRRGSEENCMLIARKAAGFGAKIVVGSDAHICFDVGNFDKALRIIREAGLPEENILNTSAEKVIAYLKSKGRELLPKQDSSSKM